MLKIRPPQVRRHGLPRIRCPSNRQSHRRSSGRRARGDRDRVQGRRAGFRLTRPQPGLGLRARPEELPPGEPRGAHRSDSRRDGGSRRRAAPARSGRRRRLPADDVQCLAARRGDPARAESHVWRAARCSRLGRARRITRRRQSSKPRRPSTLITLSTRSRVTTPARKNLGVTSGRVEEIIDEARRRGRKAIVFVTGVPGAGKTLVGLNVATHKRDDSPDARGVPVRQRPARQGSERSPRARRGHAAAAQQGHDAQGRHPTEDQGLHPERAPLPRRRTQRRWPTTGSRRDLRRGSARLESRDDVGLHAPQEGPPGVHRVRARVPALVPQIATATGPS